MPYFRMLYQASPVKIHNADQWKSQLVYIGRVFEVDESPVPHHVYERALEIAKTLTVAKYPLVEECNEVGHPIKRPEEYYTVKDQ